MKSKLFARILCIVLCLTIVVSIVLLAIPLLKGSAAAVPVKGGSGYITDDYVNLRSGPGINNPVVTVMMKNTAVTFEESVLYNSEWYKIKELKTNQSGYVNKDFVAAYNDEESPIKLGASKASTYKGCQYVFSQTGAVNPTWTSSNTSVATIDSRGILTAKSAGVTTITASENGNSARCTFTVMNGTSTGISNSSLNIPQGTSATLTASAGGVRWFSTNPAVATVSGGVVKAKSMGYTAISAYNSSGASTCLVQVTDPPQRCQNLRNRSVDLYRMSVRVLTDRCNKSCLGKHKHLRCHNRQPRRSDRKVRRHHNDHRIRGQRSVILQVYGNVRQFHRNFKQQYAPDSRLHR